ncbi:cytochrome C oxidase subunit IV family protein [Paenibacillus thiaminolyticus]|uniref:Cytochrome C oxidase subunit IV family protein n=1 Tax=Paenibacillus thiaminolyticus TaxID=49283 RepID=A0AAP9DR82_PANTH|nr:cytochrome C oxidase subunit IV family protein [Paenibacillus thiaminolyticus]MCY9535556.1 cytochrome C oxidase subunit IV family protein [Paenibacillus thiaminolyticus]MCY9601671.1 cytochrome C oxidase subunit IV family protein [Paenibacillus thiaminolyticus]MCY9610708.1 cytochrome C oxidase subunit IV family protein [Paenibacillus thiaminolyticus]MCY9615879.1 cytochrome C oxidase subunit IV family protein [Paenibacillus thiaminolyticus]MCY9622118.1 cytochrome C oxidase subunit IV family p
MAQQDTTAPQDTGSHGFFRSYTLGFLFSIVLTIIPVTAVLYGWAEGIANTAILMTAAVLQFIVQLIYFMHLREEPKPRYNLVTLILGLIILLVIVVGSMWIMLYNMVAT